MKGATRTGRKRGHCVFALAGAFAGGMLAGDYPEASSGSGRLTDIELRNLVELKPDGFMPEVAGARLYSGKNSFLLNPFADPPIANNNYRYLLQRTTGVMLEEEELQGTHFNVGMRGMTPNNAVFTQVYQDGFPLNVDTFGTRMVISAPDLNQVSQMQLVTGGSSVLFGPQPGGSINFLSYPVAGDQLYRLRNTAIGGYYGHFSDLFEVSGTLEDYSYSAFARYSRGDGTDVQPGFDSKSAGARLIRRFGEKDTVSLEYQAYIFDSDLLSSVITGAVNQALGVNGLLNYYYQHATQHRLNLLYQHEFAPETRAESRVWFHYTEGSSDYGQAAGGAILGLATEKFYNWGTDTRLIHEYDWGNFSGNQLTAGFTVQGTTSPFDSGPTPANAPEIHLDRHDLNWALYAENKFQILERWSVTPAFRFEYAELAGDGIRETFGGGGQTVDRSFSDYAPLFSVGSEVDLLAPRGIDKRPLVFYANVSSAYRPPTYAETVMQEAVVTEQGLVNAQSYQIESGLRGTPTPWFLYNLSAFWMRYDKQFAFDPLNSTIQNSGRTLHRGVEWFQEVNLFGLIDAWHDVPVSTRPRLGPRSPDTESGLARNGRLSLFTSLSYLNTEIERSPDPNAVGLEVPYAPRWIFKTGLGYNYFERIKAMLGLRYVSHYLGNANNDNSLVTSQSGAQIPSYTVVDFSAEYSCWKDRLTFFLNLNNLLDRNYFAGLQGQLGGLGGQITAPGRNIYGGVRLSF